MMTRRAQVVGDQVDALDGLSAVTPVRSCDRSVHGPELAKDADRRIAGVQSDSVQRTGVASGPFRTLRHAVVNSSTFLLFRGQTDVFGVCNCSAVLTPNHSVDWPLCPDCQIQIGQYGKRAHIDTYKGAAPYAGLGVDGDPR